MALCTNSIYVVHIQVNFNHISSSSAALLEALCTLVEYDFEVQGIIVAAFYHLCALILDRNFLWCENCLLLAVPLLHHDKWCSFNSCSGAQLSASSLPASATGSTATAAVQWHAQASQLLSTYQLGPRTTITCSHVVTEIFIIIISLSDGGRGVSDQCIDTPACRYKPFTLTLLHSKFSLSWPFYKIT